MTDKLSRNIRDHARRRQAPSKKQITLRLDADIIDWFAADGAGYQTRINDALRTYISAMTPQRRGWDQADDQFLRRHYRRKGVAYCATELSRSEQAVHSRASALGLTL